MAFFDFLTGNSNAKRDIKNKEKDAAAQQQNQSNQTYGQILPWVQQSQQNASGLFNPGGVGAGNASADSGAKHQEEAFAGQTGALDSQHNALTDMYAHPGYTAGEQRDLKLSATEPIAGAYGSAAGQVGHHAALTGNSMGLIPAQAQFARAKARDVSMAAHGASRDIADARVHGQEFATTGFGSEAAGRAQLGNNAGQIGVAGLDRVANERANVAAGLAPAQTLTGVYNTALGGANQLQGQQFAQANQPGFLKQAALAGIQAAGNTFTKAL